MTPFITFITPTHRRPQGLARCIESVRTQTQARAIEHLVLPDHVGLGVAGGLFGRLPEYLDAVHGDYVHLLCDDDVLDAPDVVERLMQTVRKAQSPPVVTVRARKGLVDFPVEAPDAAPALGKVDLSMYVTRHDVYRRHVRDYGLRYEGDYDHARALYACYAPFTHCDVRFVVGGASKGAPE